MVYQIAQRLAGNKVDYSFLTRSIDTLALARAWKMGIKLDNSSPESLLSSQYKIVRHYDRKIKCSLGQLNKDFELGFNENDLHNASVDSRLLMEVFKKLLWQVEI
jgi:hypothetical protein